MPIGLSELDIVRIRLDVALDEIRRLQAHKKATELDIAELFKNIDDMLDVLGVSSYHSLRVTLVLGREKILQTYANG